MVCFVVKITGPEKLEEGGPNGTSLLGYGGCAYRSPGSPILTSTALLLMRASALGLLADLDSPLAQTGGSPNGRGLKRDHLLPGTAGPFKHFLTRYPQNENCPYLLFSLMN